MTVFHSTDSDVILVIADTFNFFVLESVWTLCVLQSRVVHISIHNYNDVEYICLIKQNKMEHTSHKNIENVSSVCRTCRRMKKKLNPRVAEQCLTIYFLLYAMASQTQRCE